MATAAEINKACARPSIKRSRERERERVQCTRTRADTHTRTRRHTCVGSCPLSATLATVFTNEFLVTHLFRQRRANVFQCLREPRAICCWIKRALHAEMSEWGGGAGPSSSLSGKQGGANSKMQLPPRQTRHTNIRHRHTEAQKHTHTHTHRSTETQKHTHLPLT